MNELLKGSITVKLKLSSLFILVIMGLLSACTSVQFNAQYSASNWEKVLVVPFEGDKANYANQLFIHHFVSNSSVQIIPFDAVSSDDINFNNPIQNLSEVFVFADNNGYQGVIVGTLATGKSQYGNYDKRRVMFSLRLYDSKTGSIVGSSISELDSFFESEKTLIKDAVQDVTSEFEAILGQL